MAVIPLTHPNPLINDEKEWEKANDVISNPISFQTSFYCINDNSSLIKKTT